MSNSKTAIGEIKKLMVQFGFLNEESTPLSFKLADNTILQTSKLEAGSKIVKINEAFEMVALEDGEYRLVENFSIEVVNGEIKSVREIFVDAKLVDGTVVKVEGDSLVEGAKVLVVTADAEIPAPDGVHELSDGTKIETKDGIIASVIEAMGEYPEMEKPESEVEIEVKKEGMESEVVALLKELVVKLGEKIAALEGKVEGMNAEFNSFRKEPGAKKIADGKVSKFNKVDDYNDALDAKVASIMSLRK
jgi:membrane-associated protease RseP (regulator of RpoE activity)